MEHIQQPLREAVSAAKKVEQALNDDYQLSHSGAQQQFHSTAAEELAYNAIDHRVTYHKTQYAYDEKRNQYTEAAFNDYREEAQGQPGNAAGTYDYESQSGCSQNQPGPERQAGRPGNSGTVLSGPSAASIPPPHSGPSGPDPPGGSPLSGTAHKWDGTGFGTAEAPELWKRTNRIIQNDEKIKKLDRKRRYVQRGYTRLAAEIGGREFASRGRLKFNYYGKVRLSDKTVELLRIGRGRYEGKIVREKQNRRDYNDRREKKEKKAFRRRAAGRLTYRTGRRLTDDEAVPEDETIGALKSKAGRAVRVSAMTVRQDIKALRLQNNVYARYEQAQMKREVLHHKKSRFIKKQERKADREQIRAAQSRAQKKKLKKMMVQRHAREEENFFRRAKQQFMVRKTAREYRRRAVKRTMTTLLSACSLMAFVILFLMILLLVFLSVTQGGSEYAAAAVTQNDYSTITEATAYFRKLETDLDEYLNADREALEAELEAQYGPDIYEFIYELADFGFSANTLIAYLSAVYGEFTLADIQEELNEIFEEMYKLTIETKMEERDVLKYDPDADDFVTVKESKKICYVTLEKKELEDVVKERLPEELAFQYGAYHLSTGGQQVYAPVMREDWTQKISSNYGERIHPITKVRTVHRGVDIAIPTGTKLYSAVTGTVIKSYYSDTAGNMVTVQTDTGWTVTFMHMDSRAVSAGQKIEQGDFVGLSGNSGNSTGPHLHLQVDNPDGKSINPIFIIPQTCAAKTETEE